MSSTDASASPGETCHTRFRQPSEKEAQCFYHGLPSRPRLLGRTSDYSWADEQAVEPGPFTFRRRKTLSSIGDHAIRACWYDQVLPDIEKAVASLDWTSIDVFRIGYEDVPRAERPVVVWIGVGRADTPWADVARALAQCRTVLDAAGLEDVDCQMRVSAVSLLMAGPTLQPPPSRHVSETLCAFVQPFTTAIGQSIFPLEQDTVNGTLGVYVVGPSRRMCVPPLYALTCRHVGLPNSLHPDNNKHYHRRHASQKPLFMGMPGKKAYDMAVAGLESYKDAAVEGIAVRDDGYGYVDDRDAWFLASVTKLLNITKSFASVQDRIIGSVLLAPPIGPGHGLPFPWTRDWCLIQLDLAKFPNGTYPANVVDIRTRRYGRYDLKRLLTPHMQNGRRYRYPPNGIMALSGTIPLDEMMRPQSLNADGEECFLVGKRGAGTGLTWGAPSELLSLVRTCVPGAGGGEFRSMEWAVRGSLEEKRMPFSAPGDSGAAVFDAGGRLGGLLTRGSGDSTGTIIDITYVTPIEPLLADIQRTLGQEVRLL